MYAISALDLASTIGFAGFFHFERPFHSLFVWGLTRPTLVALVLAFTVKRVRPTPWITGFYALQLVVRHVPRSAQTDEQITFGFSLYAIQLLVRASGRGERRKKDNPQSEIITFYLLVAFTFSLLHYLLHTAFISGHYRSERSEVEAARPSYSRHNSTASTGTIVIIEEEEEGHP